MDRFVRLDGLERFDRLVGFVRLERLDRLERLERWVCLSSLPVHEDFLLLELLLRR